MSQAAPPGSSHTQNSGHKVRRPRAARACNLCRLKKNKCDELYPCTYCRSMSSPCLSPCPSPCLVLSCLALPCPALLCLHAVRCIPPSGCAVHTADQFTQLGTDRNVECVYQGQDVARGRFTPE